MKSAKHILLGGMLAAIVIAVAPSASAQTITGTPGLPSATETLRGNQLPAPALPFGGVIKETLEGSKVWWPPLSGKRLEVWVAR